MFSAVAEAISTQGMCSKHDETAEFPPCTCLPLVRCEELAKSLQVELHGRALLPVGADEQVVVVRDDEPTSIVAYFLSTR